MYPLLVNMNTYENKLSEFTGSKHVIAVMNGTCALQIALRLSGVNLMMSLIPALSFVATANASNYWCNTTLY